MIKYMQLIHKEQSFKYKGRCVINDQYKKNNL